MPDSIDARRLDLPFDADRLDELLTDAGIDVLLVTSKHNIQYLLGGYRYFFCEHSDAIGVSRYLPVLVYPRGRVRDTSYVGQRMEAFEVENGAFWTGKVDTTTWGSVPAIEVAIEHVRALGGSGRIGIEFSFMPADAASVLRDAFPGREIVDAHFPLERLRAVKTVSELEKIRQASERVVDAMRATFDALRPGLTKHAVVDLLRRHEIERDLEFEYCLISAGTSLNRAPSDQVLRAGDILTLDSGGRFEGYVGDLCRMGILGEPDAELEDLLAEVEAIQQAARLPVRAGTPAEAIYAAAEPLLARSAHREVLEFVAHGVGLITHEAPRISATAPVPYAAYDAKRPLAAGMVLSVETTLAHRRRGMIKLEDTLCVTEGGCVSYGDGGRGWNKARGAAPGPR